MSAVAALMIAVSSDDAWSGLKDGGYIGALVYMAVYFRGEMEKVRGRLAEEQVENARLRDAVAERERAAKVEMLDMQGALQSEMLAQHAHLTAMMLEQQKETIPVLVDAVENGKRIVDLLMAFARPK